MAEKTTTDRRSVAIQRRELVSERLHGSPRSGGIPPMIIIGIGFLVLFSAISVMLGNEDPRHDTDPRDQLALWARFSAH